MEVSIIIVNYNTKQLIFDCISSVIEQTRDISYEIIIVDNASIDGSQQMIKTNFPGVILLESGSNLGFGKANNLGAAIAKGKFLFFLNSDTYLVNNALQIFLDFVSSNVDLEIGCLGTFLVDEYFVENGSGGDFPSLAKYLISRIRPILIKFSNSREVSADDKRKVDYILGADMFIPKTVFDEVGGFDERYFMYYEESDMQLSMAKLGYARLIISGPKIIHLEGKSSFNSIDKIMMVQSSAFKYYKKNRPYGEYLLFRLFCILDGLRFFLKREYPIKDAIRFLRFNFKKAS